MLLSSVGLGGRWYLQAAILLFFDLDNPEYPLSEQQLWPLAQEILGQDAQLDAGFPKARGEFLAAGRAFWPGLSTLKESFSQLTGRQPQPGRALAHIQVGPLKRSLAVFGPRRWLWGPSGAAPSQPGDFKTLPLTWASAYGGPGHPDNPAGLGRAELLSPVGEKYRPLPLVEDALELMGGPDDEPQPASFLPRPLSWPSRKALAGTYDDRWLRQRWPGFPDDLKPEFFSSASPGQLLPEGFFQGGEKIVIEGCHQKIYRQESFVPRRRVRLFVTGAPNPDEPDKQSFFEASTRLDTVWLFPEFNRGLVIHRALLPTADEEFGGLSILFVVSEEAQSQPRDLQEYLEEQKRRQSAAAPVDMSPFQKAADAVNEMVRNLRTFEQDANLALDRHLGQAPIIPMSLEEMLDEQTEALGEMKAFLASQKDLLRQSKKEFGHLMPIDVRLLDPLAESLDKMEADLAQNRQALAQIRADTGAMRHKQFAALDEKMAALPPETQETLKQKFSDSGLMALRERDFLDPLADHSPWSRQAMLLLAEGRRGLKKNPEAQKRLSALGLRARDMEAALVGFLAQTQTIDLTQWGLTGEPPLSLGPGWLLPQFEGAQACALLFRPLALDEPFNPALPHPEDILVPGSQPCGRLLAGGLGRPLVLAPDLLTAWLLYAEAGDQYMILQLDSPQTPLPEGCQELIASAPLALTWLPEALTAQPEALEQRLAPWRAAVHPHLKALSFDQGPHLWAARKRSLNIRGQMMNQLPAIGLAKPPEYGVSLPQDPQDSQGLKIVPLKVDTEGLVQRGQARVKAFVEAKTGEPLAQIERLKKELVEQGQEFNRYLEPHGYQLEQIVQQIQPGPEPPQPPVPSGPSAELLKAMDEAIDKASSMGVLTPKGQAEFQQIRDSHLEVSTKAQQLYQQTEELRLKGEARLKNPFPPEEIEKFQELELDIDPAGSSVEKVIELHRQGRTIKNRDLSGLDFSGLDLRGLRLERCFVDGGKFAAADLSDSRWDMVSGQAVDFSGAKLPQASFHMVSLTKSLFSGADLRGLKGSLSDFSQSVFERAELRASDFDKCIFNGVSFTKASKLSGARFYMSNFYAASLQGLIIEDLELDRCNFIEATAEKTHFHNCALPGTAFLKSRLSELSFDKCRLPNIRFTYGSDLKNIRFHFSDLSQASFNEASLPYTLFEDCLLAGAAVENCDLRYSRFIACRAPKALIRKSDLRGAHMVALDLAGASLRRSDLGGADLSYANCQAAEFYKTGLSQTIVAGANLRFTLLEGREDEASRLGYISLKAPKSTETEN